MQYITHIFNNCTSGLLLLALHTIIKGISLLVHVKVWRIQLLQIEVRLTNALVQCIQLLQIESLSSCISYNQVLNHAILFSLLYKILQNVLPLLGLRLMYRGIGNVIYIGTILVQKKCCDLWINYRSIDKRVCWNN